MSIKNNKNKLMIAAIAGVIAAMLVYLNFSIMQNELNVKNHEIEKMKNAGGSQSSLSYWVAKDFIAENTVINDDLIEFKNVGVIIKDGVVNKNDILGQAVLNDVKAENVLTYGMFPVSSQDTNTKTNYRSISVPYENLSGMSEHIKENGYVDIYSTSQKIPYKIEGVKVVSFDKDSEKQMKTVTFEIPKFEVPSFVSAMSTGKFLLIASEKPSKENIAGDYPKNLSAFEGGIPDLAPLNVSGEAYVPPPVGYSEISSRNNNTLPSGTSVEVIQANTKTEVTVER